MIHLLQTDRVGLGMFEYCFARVLAQRFSYALEARPLLGFSGSRVQIAGEEILGPKCGWSGQWPYEAYSGRSLARAELFQAPGAKITLRGDFQRFEFIADVREEVRADWFRMDGPLPVRAIGDLLICLHFNAATGGKKMPHNSGALSPNSGLLGVEEIRRLAKTVQHEQLFIVTDEPGHPTIGALGALRPEIHMASGMEALRFIHSFQKVAISQNVLHWWGAFLGRVREIYFPKIDRGPWSHPEPALLAHDPAHWGIDLRVPDDDRYIYDW